MVLFPISSAWHGGARLESIYPSFGHQDADSKKLCSDIVFNWALVPNSKQLRLSLHGSETCLTCWVKKKKNHEPQAPTYRNHPLSLLEPKLPSVALTRYPSTLKHLLLLMWLYLRLFQINTEVKKEMSFSKSETLVGH